MVGVCVCVCSEPAEEPLRVVPEFIDEDGKLSFTHIAHRAKTESVNWYTVLSLGLQLFLRSREVAKRGDKEVG